MTWIFTYIRSRMEVFNIEQKRADKVRAFSEYHFSNFSSILAMDVHCVASTCHIIIMEHFWGPEVARLDRKWTENGQKMDQKRTKMTDNDYYWSKGQVIVWKLESDELTGSPGQYFGVSSGGCRAPRWPYVDLFQYVSVEPGITPIICQMYHCLYPLLGRKMGHVTPLIPDKHPEYLKWYHVTIWPPLKKFACPPMTIKRWTHYYHKTHISMDLYLIHTQCGISPWKH